MITFNEWSKNYNVIGCTPAEGSKKWKLLSVDYLQKDNYGADVKMYFLCPFNSVTGDAFNSDTRGTIVQKHIGLIVGRPLHALIRTVFELTMIPFTVSLLRHNLCGVENIEPFRHVEDAYRILGYSARMELISLKIVLLGLFCPIDWLYDDREAYGKLEREMNWGERSNQPYTLAPCMQRIANIFNTEAYGVKKEDVKYASDEPKFIGLVNIAFQPGVSRYRYNV
jgi:hypothetical protein